MLNELKMDPIINKAIDCNQDIQRPWYKDPLVLSLEPTAPLDTRCDADKKVKKKLRYHQPGIPPPPDYIFVPLLCRGFRASFSPTRKSTSPPPILLTQETKGNESPRYGRTRHPILKITNEITPRGMVEGHIVLCTSSPEQLPPKFNQAKTIFFLHYQT